MHGSVLILNYNHKMSNCEMYFIKTKQLSNQHDIKLQLQNKKENYLGDERYLVFEKCTVCFDGTIKMIIHFASSHLGTDHSCTRHSRTFLVAVNTRLKYKEEELTLIFIYFLILSECRFLRWF